MKNRNTYILILTLALGIIPYSANAMHIMEGYLSPKWVIFWAVVCIPFLFLGYREIEKSQKKTSRALIILGLCGAFAFVLSALKLPSVTGSSSHPTGVGLGAIIFGPFTMSIVSLIVLLFQALTLAHGGITTLGANVFSMGIVGPITSFIVYKLGKKARLNTSISVFLAAALGNLATYLMTSAQLALAFPTGGSILVSFIKFAGIFALTQVPLAIVEGLVTVIIFGIIEKYSIDELKELNTL